MAGRGIVCMALLGALWAAPALPQPPPQTLPFGLDGFRWRMTEAEASARYAALGPRTSWPADAAPADQKGERVWPVAWRDCRLEIYFYFANVENRGLLSEIDVMEDEHGTPACDEEMRQELRTHLGEPDSDSQGREMVWDTPESRRDKLHPDEVAKRFAGMSAFDRFRARNKEGRGPLARFVVSPWGPRVFLWAPGMPGRIEL